jgi:hypothetical protein
MRVAIGELRIISRVWKKKKQLAQILEAFLETERRSKHKHNPVITCPLKEKGQNLRPNPL